MDRASPHVHFRAIKHEPGSPSESGGAPYTDIDVAPSVIKRECEEYFGEADQLTGLSRMHVSTLINSTSPPILPGRVLDSESTLTTIKMTRGLTRAPMKLFSCPQCPYSSRRRGDFGRHELTHSGLKLFFCSHCPYSCNRKASLRFHMLTHTRQRLLSCSHCTFLCNDNKLLRIHRLTHAAEKLFSCSLCNFVCNNKRFLRIHVIDHARKKRKQSLDSKAGSSMQEVSGLASRLTDRHFMGKCPPTRRQCAVKRCVVCQANKIRRESRYLCKQCRVGLCVEPCFEIFHTRENYKTTK